MPRQHRRQVPKHGHHRQTGKGSHVGQPDNFVHMQARSTAQRYALQDRSGRALHCNWTQKLMYDTEEIAQSTAEALGRLRHQHYSVYPCPRGSHFHLTTMEQEARREA